MPNHQEHFSRSGIRNFLKPIEDMISKVTAHAPIFKVISSKMFLQVETFSQAVTQENGIAMPYRFGESQRINSSMFEV